MSITAKELTDLLKREALRLGFHLAGACPAVAPSGVRALEQWLAAGYAGQMHYIERRRAAYDHPKHVLEGVCSVLMLAIGYRTVEPSTPQPGQGRVSRYAWGDDYHDLIGDRLGQLAQLLQTHLPGARVRGVVDTAPMLEREFAQLAGLGWVGKNTLLLNRQWGSWFFLAALLTDAVLDYDVRREVDHCGTCRACLDACPTNAFVQAYVLDSRRCLSYLTIEHRTSIPGQLRTQHGDWLFGCDVCQEVCPWNRRVPPVDQAEFEPRPGSNPLELAALFKLDDEAFRRRFRRTPLWRAKRRGILRNAAIVLGNQRALLALGALKRGLDDAEPLVRGACAWALGQYDGPEAREALTARLAVEDDEEVRQEIVTALRPGG